jgi:hypothetical protein
LGFGECCEGFGGYRREGVLQKGEDGIVSEWDGYKLYYMVIGG